jgi:hypothetical protein
MVAHDNLNPEQFYHASPHPFSEGDQVEPGHAPVGSMKPKEHVFVTTSKSNAKQWARQMGGAAYSVSAPREYEPDPLPTGRGEYQTRESLTVQGRVYKSRGKAA